jgi:hypothetical protein
MRLCAAPANLRLAGAAAPRVAKRRAALELGIPVQARLVDWG